MKTSIGKTVYIYGTVFLFLAGTGFVMSNHHFSHDWEIPEHYKQMENPVEMDEESIRMGQSMYRRECRSCHGAEGAGDGTEAQDLETPLRDFGSEEVQKHSDGELFYKIKEGRDEMPSFEGDMHEVDIWHIVNYIRTLEEEEN